MNRLRLAFPLFSVPILAFVLSLFAFYRFTPEVAAQNTATLEGVITDLRDAAVSDAAIALQAIPSSPANQRDAASGADGHFAFDVPPGRYHLTITHASLRRFDREIELAAGANPELRVQLAIEPLSASVVVSAAAEPVATTAVTVPVDIVTRQEIDQRQALELAPLLETLPGVNFGQTGPAGGVASLFLDGGNSNYTKVLVDGVSANEPGGGIDFSNLTLANIDKIEVVHGAESALDGSDAMTGTIEVLTHRGTTHTPLLVIDAEGGSLSTGQGDAQVSGLDGRIDYSAAYGYSETQGQGPNDRFLNRTLSGNLGLRLAEHDALRVTLRSNASDAGEPGQTLFVPPNLTDYNNVHNITAGLAWNFSTGKHWQHKITASETDVHQLYFDPFFTTQNQYNRADFQAQSSYVARQATLTAGYWYEVENGYVAFLGNEHVRRNNQAGFLDGRWQPTGRLTVNAGVRVENNTSFATRVVPRAGAAYVLRYGRDFWGATRLRSSFGQGIKEPRLYESFGTDPCNPGNPNLLPEQSLTFSVGIEQHLDRERMLVSADYFANQFTDMISFNSTAPTTDCPFGVGQYFNTDQARARGANLSLQARAARWLSVHGNYSYDDSRVVVSPLATNPAELPGNHLIRRPVNSGSLVLDGTWRRVQANLAGLFVGRRTDSDFQFPSLGLTSNPGYMRLDLAASFRISSRLSLLGRVQNLFGKDYQDALGYPALGRVAYGGVRLRIGGDQ